MSKLTWLDQTLNTAVRWQLTGRQLEELACRLLGLEIKQADICLDDWYRYCPGLTGVQKYLSLRGITSLAEPGLEQAERVGLQKVAVVCRAIRQDQLNSMLEGVMDEANRRHLQVSLLVEGLSGSGAPELMAMANMANNYGIASVIYDDGKGNNDPFTTFDQITILTNKLSCPVEVRLGNAYGLATANSLAAVKAGVRHIASAVAGIGGFVPWEEVLLAAKQLLGLGYELPQDLAGKCQQVLTVLELTVPESKAVIGQSVFAHESGLHVDGVTKLPELYEPFAPELVGLNRKLIIGKHSGSTALKTKFAAWGIQLEEVEAKYLLALVRALAVNKKTALTDDELQLLYRSS